VGVASFRSCTVLGVATLSLSLSGCALFHDAVCLTAYKMHECVADCCESSRNRKLAKLAWRTVRCANPDAAYSKDYEAGFEDGFAHYLYRGGNGEPPPLPPKHYRKIAYQTPQGYRAIEDWFEGYRHGASVARDSGYRQFVTGPSAFASSPPPVAPAAERGFTVVPPAEPPRETLDHPRMLPAPAATLPGPRVRARILRVRSLGPVVQPEL
jgi:hypothetical protein